MGKEIDQIIDLYRQFPQYKDHSYDSIFWHIYPSIKSKQYKFFNKKAFCNWAYLSNQCANMYKQYAKIGYNDWNTGSNIFLVDVVAIGSIKDLSKWLKNYFTKELGLNKSVSWIRLCDNKINRITKRYTKRHYRWDQ